jgi:hypothetical protein
MGVMRINVAVDRVVGPAAPGAQDGSSLMEVMMAAMVLIVGIFAMVQFVSSAAFRVRDSEDRLVLHQVANQELEEIRALPYDKVGTEGGNPSGGHLVEDETVTVEGVSVRIQREVIYIEDPAYHALASTPYPANYRRATIRVAAVGNNRIDPVEVTTNIAGGAQGGTLDITVTNKAGAPAPDVLLVITNTHLSPNVNIDSDAIRTDDNGKMLVPGLTVDGTANYFVRGDKAGYNSYQIRPGKLVNEGWPFTTASLVVDLLGTINIHLTDDATAPAGLGNIPLRVTGPLYIPPYTYTTVVTTDGQGNFTLPNLAASALGSALNPPPVTPYSVQLVSPGSRPPLRRVPPVGETPPVTTPQAILSPGETQQLNLVWPR